MEAVRERWWAVVLTSGQDVRRGWRNDYKGRGLETPPVA